MYLFTETETDSDIENKLMVTERESGGWARDK